MQQRLLGFLLGAVWVLGAQAFSCPPGPWQQQPSRPLPRSRSKGTALALFDFFGGSKKAAAAEVVETKQGVTPAAARRAIKITDSGAKLPALYGGWFDGSLANDMANALKAALKDVRKKKPEVRPPT